MKWYMNMKISAKLLSGFIMVAIIAAAIGVVGIISLKSIDKSDTELYENQLVPTTQLAEINKSFQMIRVDVRDILIERKVEKMQVIEDSIKTKKIEMQKLSTEYEKTILSDKMQVAFKDYTKKKDDFDAQLDSVLILAKTNKNLEAEVLISVTGISGKASKALQESIDSLITMKSADAKIKSENNSINANRAIDIMIILLIAGVLIAIALGFFLSNIISKPLKLLADAADKVAVGEVDVNIKAKTKDEIGKLMVSFAKMVDNIKSQAQSAEKISRGDLNVEIIPKSDKDVLSKSLKLVLETLQKLVAEAQMLTKAAVEGKLSIRGNEDVFKGGYKEIVLGINKTLDAVIEPVKEASEVLKQMANGNLKVQVKGDYKGDHGDIKNALNDTIDSLSSYVTEISEVLDEMSNSNLQLTINNEYKGDFAQIKDALNLIIQSFNEVFTEINTAADQVSAGSNQVSDGSQALSQGTTEQASSIEELTASITEVAAQTKQNAVNASQANELALNAKEGAALGNSHMKEMLKSMEEINESSSSISKIIKVIDDIAFQTNMLALNAAVEAARAGQHGKGFAVVAEEVRNLAARSAKAAKETTDLVEGSIKKVEIGTKIANNTAESLDQIVVGISKAATLVGEIAAASNEQATAIYQINKGIEQVSDVVQTNSATAEQSAAASEELSSQASMLKSMVGKFNLKGGSTASYMDVSLGGPQNISRLNKKFPAHAEAAATKSKPKISLSNMDFGKY
ncbi:methyl-accepting chemotaxis protein [Clostridium tagluense]|uniref:HAMP domain-containing methyl-accepting chemotaxis protein n=1 Tax=Clostridium tagluense TaxID=360422 RepID=UPI001C0C4C53|nr:methyl-accepting chemotaxis protein [Clostridium tagluense]MBU3127596.1 MCP four helix bundle domain-containing protein [Clostridium tagluense]MCB2312612.1 methyl-accepting chemotaxis protein [Clostridium tagluense]MCB2317288.1 methyl-accepting chemotaxis protein [Clostridium tagluense]MCB2322155.1 methyl-accepting chemotaxis protein [Clostridium tagluense]MCB2327084.1 methyl-accepting chemotaxis protein [Clostridium tagluense]